MVALFRLDPYHWTFNSESLCIYAMEIFHMNYEIFGSYLNEIIR